MPFRRLLPTPSPTVDPIDAYRLPPESATHVRANMVTSSDGAATYRGHVGPLTGQADQELLYALRALADVVLVGAGTVRAEGYEVPLVLPHLATRRRDEGKPEQPRLAIVSGSLDLDLTASAFTASRYRPLLLTCDAVPPDRVRAAERVADVLVVGDEVVDVAKAVDGLAADGMRHVLTEGGPHLLAQLITARLVDELCLTVAPRIVAGAGLRMLAGPELQPPTRTTLSQMLTADDYLFLTYRLTDA